MDIVRIVKDRKKRTNSRVAYMLALCVTYKWNLLSHKHSFVDPNYICVICEIVQYEGELCKDVPADLRSWFLSPEHYEEYITLANSIK